MPLVYNFAISFDARFKKYNFVKLYWYNFIFFSFLLYFGQQEKNLIMTTQQKTFWVADIKPNSFVHNQCEQYLLSSHMHKPLC